MSLYIQDKKEEEDILLSRLRDGDSATFTIIYEKYHRLLYVLAYKYLKNTSMAEDAVQQVFMKFWESRLFLVEQMNLRNYLYTMMKNWVLNELRNHNNALKKNYELIQETSGYDDSLLKYLENKDLMSHFYRILEQLPKQKRQVCLYKLKYGLSTQEIADSMHLSIPTVKTHFTQGLKLIRGKMEKLLIFVALIF